MGILFAMSSFYKDHFIKNPIAEKSNWELGLTNRNYDFAFVGASDVNRDIDVKTIQQKTGLTGINLAQDGSCVEENLLLFKKFIFNGNKVRHIFLQLYTRDLDPSTRFDINTEKFVPFIQDTAVSRMLQRHTPDFHFFLWKNIPFLTYAEYNSKYPVDDFFCAEDRHKLFDSFNETSGTELLDKAGHKFTGSPYFTSSLVIDENISEFISFAKSRGIKMTVITLPRWITSVKKHQNRKEFADKVDSLCEKNNVKYFNFASDKLQWYNHDSLFYDNNHFNKKGALYFSALFADSVILREVERK
jgi:hypothetical protein